MSAWRRLRRELVRFVRPTHSQRLLYVAPTLLAMFLLAPRAAARGVHHQFVPSELDLNEAGVLELALSTGWAQSEGPGRIILPEIGLYFGIFEDLELDVEWGFAIEGPDTGPFALDHGVPDNPWLSLVWRIVGPQNREANGLTLGVQIGPTFPVAPEAQGIGAEGLVLVGVPVGPAVLTLNAGGLIAPGPLDDRPAGVEGGADLTAHAGTWLVSLNLGGVRFLSDDPNQLAVGAGLQLAPMSHLDVFMTGRLGILDGSDRWSVMAGVASRMRIFEP